MNFENAHKGIGLLFTGLILEIVSEICAGAALIVGTGAGTLDSVALIVFGLASGIVGIVAFIQALRGLAWARKDEPCFGYALAIIIITLVVSIVAGIIGASDKAGGIGTTIVTALSALFECVTIVLICDGISNIYRQKGNLERAKEGLTTGIIFVILYAVAKAFEVLVTSKYTTPWGSVVSIVLAIVTLVLIVVAFIKFVVYLSRAKSEI